MFDPGSYMRWLRSNLPKQRRGQRRDQEEQHAFFGGGVVRLCLRGTHPSFRPPEGDSTFDLKQNGGTDQWPNGSS